MKQATPTSTTRTTRTTRSGKKRAKANNAKVTHVDVDVEDDRDVAVEREKTSSKKEKAWTCLKCAVSFILATYLLIPLIIKLNPWIISEVVFMHRVSWPPFINISDPQQLGLDGARSLSIGGPNGGQLGLWHILPKEIQVSCAQQQHCFQNTEFFQKSLKSGDPIVMYSHGQAGTRAAWHRVALYKVLSNMGYHVITYDYRGYADSSGDPSESGLIEDSHAVYTWIKRQSSDAAVHLWGHSMGAGVTTQLARLLCLKGRCSGTVTLEAPFTNVLDAATSHPLGLPYTYVPWFASTLEECFKSNNISFANDRSIKDISMPILILHAADDGLIPHSMGEKLSTIARESGRDVQFHSFAASLGHGHKHIHRNPGLPHIMRDFLAGKKVTSP